MFSGYCWLLSLGLLLIVMKFEIVFNSKNYYKVSFEAILLQFHLIFPRTDERDSHGRFEIDISIQLKQLIYAFSNSNPMHAHKPLK